ncbi:hypothetical protein ZIOFF_017715 [Zingiber officinale]|uniref:Uncharacterized protein n=1 Tax=Zingiber officinale TaxID=94328 RepID=A0A8J5H528_ZINOF|nr:hypothetical protein ZIOFF_017715 [Zingiber officinale]
MAQEDKLKEAAAQEEKTEESGRTSIEGAARVKREIAKKETGLSREQREEIHFRNVVRKKDFICLERVNTRSLISSMSSSCILEYSALPSKKELWIWSMSCKRKGRIMIWEVLPVKGIKLGLQAKSMKFCMQKKDQYVKIVAHPNHLIYSEKDKLICMVVV